MKVKINDEGEKDISEALCVSKDRKQYLATKINSPEALNTRKIASRISYIAQFCDTNEELAWVCFIVGVNARRKRDFSSIFEGLGHEPEKQKDEEPDWSIDEQLAEMEKCLKLAEGISRLEKMRDEFKSYSK